MPRGAGPGWYQNDWRRLWDPQVEWLRCPHCRRDAPVRRLRDTLVAMIRRRLLGSIDAWESVGSWQRGWADEGQLVWRQGEIFCLPPGPMVSFSDWTMVSDMGLLRGLGREQCDYHLGQAKLASLPSS